MPSALERLLSTIETPEAFDTPYKELLPLQIEAANERFKDRVNKIKLLANRAETGNVSQVTQPSDLVPLLFAHTAYKSYPEGWLADGKWDRMGKWLETVSAYPVQGIDLDGVDGLDDWVKRLETVGHYMSCSSGTTGKPALLTCSKGELDLSQDMTIATMAWGLGIKPDGSFRMIGAGGAAAAARVVAQRDAMIRGFAAHGGFYQPPGPEITVGGIAAMIAMRRKVADGSATPDEVAAFEKIAASRQAGMEEAKKEVIKEIISCRDRKLFFGGMWATLYANAEAVRAEGYSAKDFNPENIMMVAGGLKGAQLPDNFKDIIFDTFNLSPERVYQAYSMQEINTQFPLCRAGRYHIPAWVMLLMLDDTGDELLDLSGGGDVEGRAAFMDLSVDARWGGIISGDKVTANYGKCDCGHHGPTVGPEIVRYADLEAGDKLTCSGTIDAYIRGAV